MDDKLMLESIQVIIDKQKAILSRLQDCRIEVRRSGELTVEDLSFLNSFSQPEPTENSHTKNVLLTIMDCITTDNAVAPNAVGEAVFELLFNVGINEAVAEKISDAAQVLASELVADPPNYI